MEKIKKINNQLEKLNINNPNEDEFSKNWNRVYTNLESELINLLRKTKSNVLKYNLGMDDFEDMFTEIVQDFFNENR